VTAREAARALVLRYGWNAAAYQVLNPGMDLWFSPSGDAVIGYATHAGSRVVAGAPICATDRLTAVAEDFEREARRRGERVVYFGAGDRFERLRDPDDATSHRKVLLGAQPVWNPARWPDIVQRKASLRAQLHRARNKHVTVSEWPPERAENNASLRRVLAAWLATRGLPSLHFMTEPDILSDLRDRRVFVAERDSLGAIAFLIATPIPARNGWLIEQWPRLPSAPNGTTHLLVDAAMRAVADAGSDFVTLGLAPLSDKTGPIGAEEPVWLRAVLRWLRAHGRRFYNFRGLESFKASLEPGAWEPMYAVAPGTRLTPRMLLAVAGVFGGGSPELLVLRALAMAVLRELRSLRRA